MSRSTPYLLDNYCGGGGMTRGLMDAGFYVVGVDIVDQPDYLGHEFIKGDALEVLAEWGDDFDAFHASPPCQTFTRAQHLRKAQGGETSALDLVEPTRRLLRRFGKPYSIENVEGAPLHGVKLCGSMFGLAVQRHRIFESNVYMPQPACDHKAFPIDPERGKPRPIGVYHVLADDIPKGGRTARTLEEAQQAMGIDWLPWDQLKEAIPPAYGRYVGEHLMAAVEAEQVAA